MQASIASITNASAVGSPVSYVTDVDSSNSRIDRYGYGTDMHRKSAGRLMATGWVVAFRRAGDERFFATPMRELAIQAINELPGSANPEITWEGLSSLCVSFTWHRAGEPDLSSTYLAKFGLMRSWDDLHCRISSPKQGGLIPAPPNADM